MGLWATFPQRTALNKRKNMTLWEKKETTNLTLEKKKLDQEIEETRQNKKRNKEHEWKSLPPQNR